MTSPLRAHADLLASLRQAESAGALDVAALLGWRKYGGNEEQKEFYGHLSRQVTEIQHRLVEEQMENVRLRERSARPILFTQGQRN
jgi:hypothetical protein